MFSRFPTSIFLTFACAFVACASPISPLLESKRSQSIHIRGLIKKDDQSKTSSTGGLADTTVIALGVGVVFALVLIAAVVTWSVVRYRLSHTGVSRPNTPAPLTRESITRRASSASDASTLVGSQETKIKEPAQAVTRHSHGSSLHLTVNPEHGVAPTTRPTVRGPRAMPPSRTNSIMSTQSSRSSASSHSLGSSTEHSRISNADFVSPFEIRAAHYVALASIGGPERVEEEPVAGERDVPQVTVGPLRPALRVVKDLAKPGSRPLGPARAGYI